MCATARVSLAALAFVAGVLAAVATGIGTAPPAWAHASLISTTPVRDEVVARPPKEVVLRFDEPVSLGLGGLRVIGPTGERAEQGGVSTGDGGRVLRRPVAANRPGTYTVAWRAQSSDGHTVEGAFTFHVGERTGAATVEQGTAAGVGFAGWFGRWLGAAGLLATLGVLAMALLDRSTRSRLGSVTAAAGLVVVAGSAVELVAHTAEAAGVGLFEVGDLLGTAVLDDRTGTLIAARAVGGALVALAWLWRRAAESWLGAIGLGALAVAGAAALDGHAWSAPQRWLAVGADAVHLLAVGAWAGGLLALVVVARSAPPPVRAFSVLALGCAAAAVITGVVAASGQLAGVDDLWGSRYGRLVLVKLALYAALVGLGWWNRARILPAFASAVAAVRSAAPRRLGRTVRAELAVVAVVLGVTAALVATTPARPVNGAFSATKVDGGIVLALSVDPARRGANEIHGTFSALSGEIGAARVDAVEVQVASADVPARVVTAELVTADHFVASGVDLTAGRWTVTVTAVRRGVPTVSTFEVRIP